MAGAEDLVPQGLPQGERQATEAAMLEAGAPLSSAGAAPAPLTRSFAQEQPAPAGQFDALQALTPQGASPQAPGAFSIPSAPERRLQALASSQNPVLRAIARRMMG